MSERLVVGVDSSTQSTKAIAWNSSGEVVAEGRAPIDLDMPATGRAEQNTGQWWQSAMMALRQLTARIDIGALDGLAISNQRETVAFLDADGRAVRPAIVWLDERAVDEVDPFVARIGRERLHTITGKPIDLTPVIYRLAWMRRHEPWALDRSTRIVDVHGFLNGRLTGRYATSHTSADPFGVMDIRTKRYSEVILQELGLAAERLADLVAPGERIGAVTASAAAATGLPEGLPVFAGGGDGQCAGLGVDCTRPGRIYLNLGTAVITGAWALEPLIGQHWRTMTSPTGQGYFLEGAQRAGAFLVNWFIDNFAGGRDDPAIFERLETAAGYLPVGSEGALVCPYLSGCMDPHWDSRARATFTGLGTHHTTAHLYRACLEAMTLESTRCLEAMRREGVPAEEIIAVGGGANSPLWMRMIADATGLPVSKSRSVEASALGAGITAAVAAGWFESFEAAAGSMAGTESTVHPNPDTAPAWAALSRAQAQVYLNNRTT